MALERLADVLEVRYHLEYGMVPRVIESQTPEQVQRLRRVLRQMREVADRGGHSADYDGTFHRLLYEGKRVAKVALAWLTPKFGR
jgi:DNA-binding FadR family transcriptional regulator